MRYKSDAGGIQVITRAAAILRLCRNEPNGLSLGQIAERAELPRSTVQRIVQALAGEGLLLADGRSRGIRLGPEVHALAEGIRFDVVELAHPHLKRLSAETGETVDLALFRRDHMVFVDQIAGSHRLRAMSAVGEQFPMHCTANGKAALALLNDQAFDKICGKGLTRFTASTHVTAAGLRKDIHKIRATGLAYDREEHSPGICAIGAAFTDVTGAIYAISIPMPSVRFEKQHKPFRSTLQQTVEKLRIGMGLRV